VNTKVGIGVHVSYKGSIQRFVVQAGLAKRDLISKITKAKQRRDVVQVLESLLTKCKALSSNLCSTSSPTLFPLKKQNLPNVGCWWA
jgi:hypothetical protein